VVTLKTKEQLPRNITQMKSAMPDMLTNQTNQVGNIPENNLRMNQQGNVLLKTSFIVTVLSVTLAITLGRVPNVLNVVLKNIT
jgi:hypothetical protein